MVTVEEILPYLSYLVIGALLLLIFVAWIRGKKVKHVLPILMDDGWKLVESFQDLATDGATPQEILIATERLYILVKHLAELFNIPVDTLPTIQDALEIEKRHNDAKKLKGVEEDEQKK